VITKEDALTASEFHSGCEASVGPRGGIKFRPMILRRNGQTVTWKTRPEDYRVPVKHGLYQFGYILPEDADLHYTRESCPVCSAMRDHDKDPNALRSALATIAAEKILGITH
jgi:hypothetical protein